jgi:hypothetical protein
VHKKGFDRCRCGNAIEQCGAVECLFGQFNKVDAGAEDIAQNADVHVVLGVQNPGLRDEAAYAMDDADFPVFVEVDER